ncbi:MAG: hypothetical protein CSA44_01825 [Gammaproteobacteria bacterium]|nr:MAG: hypothetical protein CSA44_01825 [Gammaproteobacteria bacterium]
MKRLMSLCAFCLITTAFSGESGSPLSLLQQRYQQATLVSSQFTQEKQTQFISQPLRSTGQFSYAKNHGLIWEITTPFTSRTLFAKGNNMFIEDNHGRWVKSDNDPLNLAVAELLTELLSGHWDKLQEQFRMQPATQDQGDWSVTLDAQGRWVKKALQRLILRGNKELQHIVIIDKQGNQTVLTLKNVQLQNKTLTKSQVSAFAHP